MVRAGFGARDIGQQQRRNEARIRTKIRLAANHLVMQAACRARGSSRNTHSENGEARSRKNEKNWKVKFTREKHTHDRNTRTIKHTHSKQALDRTTSKQSFYVLPDNRVDSVGATALLLSLIDRS